MFDDLFESSRGPGVVGIFLGFVVLAGFCGLGLAVFDGRFNGMDEAGLTHYLDDQEVEIERLINREEALQLAIEEKRLNGAARDQIEMIGERVELITVTVAEVNGKVDGAKKEIETLHANHRTYRQNYRDVVRGKAVGEKIEELKTVGGRVYKSVKIKSINALGLSFTDESGPRRIDYQELPQEMRGLLSIWRRGGRGGSGSGAGNRKRGGGSDQKG